MTAYANQRRFRSTRGDINKGLYYFNKVTLICNDIEEQFINVLIYYESIGIQICDLVCDGGGSDESRMIVEAFDLDKKEIDNKSISMIHPFDSIKHIYLW